MKQLLGKSFTVTIELTENNVKFGSGVFESCDLSVGFDNVATNPTSCESTDVSSEDSMAKSSETIQSGSEENVKEFVS